MRSAISVILWIALSFFVFAGPAYSADPKIKEAAVTQAEKRIVGMEAIQKKLIREVAKAREENDIHRLNCLLTKLNLVRGLIKASDRAKVILLESFYGGDAGTAGLYLKKVNSYADSAAEVERSIPECAGLKTIGEGTTLVYINPGGEGEFAPSEKSPWDWEFVPGAEGYPAVPPASPYR
jgi:hypothetical protein